MLYQDDNVRRVNDQKRIEIQAANDNHGASDAADIDHWLLGIWDFWLHQKVKAFRQRSPSKIESLGLKVESLLRSKTTEEQPDIECDHHLTPGGKKRRMEDVATNASQKRKYVRPMDATFDETLTLWIEHGKVTIDQLEEWIARKQTETYMRERTNNNHVQIESTTSNPSTEFQTPQIQDPKTEVMQDIITSNSSLIEGDNKPNDSVCGRSSVSSSTSLEGNVQVFVN